MTRYLSMGRKVVEEGERERGKKEEESFIADAHSGCQKITRVIRYARINATRFASH